MSDRKISLSEWLAEYGDENLRLQNLNASLGGQQWGPTKKRKATRLSFLTEENLTAVINGSRMGLVVWLDKDKAEAAMQRLREKPAPSGGD